LAHKIQGSDACSVAFSLAVHEAGFSVELLVAVLYLEQVCCDFLDKRLPNSPRVKIVVDGDFGAAEFGADFLNYFPLV
jgi:hypothetical protein